MAQITLQACTSSCVISSWQTNMKSTIYVDHITTQIVCFRCAFQAKLGYEIPMLMSHFTVLIIVFTISRGFVPGRFTQKTLTATYFWRQPTSGSIVANCGQALAQPV